VPDGEQVLLGCDLFGRPEREFRAPRELELNSEQRLMAEAVISPPAIVRSG